MKYIRYEDEFLSPSGQPVYIPDPDVERQRAVAEAAFRERKQALTEKRESLGVLSPRIKANFATAITWFMDNIPFAFEPDGEPTKENPAGKKRKVTIQEAGDAYAVIVGFRAVHNGQVELEDTVYDFLVKTIEIDGTTAFSAPIAGALMTRVKDTVTLKKGKDES